MSFKLRNRYTLHGPTRWTLSKLKGRLPDCGDWEKRLPELQQQLAKREYASGQEVALRALRDAGERINWLAIRCQIAMMILREDVSRGRPWEQALSTLMEVTVTLARELEYARIIEENPEILSLVERRGAVRKPTGKVPFLRAILEDLRGRQKEVSAAAVLEALEGALFPPTGKRIRLDPVAETIDWGEAKPTGYRAFYKLLHPLLKPEK